MLPSDKYIEGVRIRVCCLSGMKTYTCKMECREKDLYLLKIYKVKKKRVQNIYRSQAVEIG